MNVYLLKDIEKLGLAGTIVKVSDGFAKNYLLPKKLVVEVTDSNRKFYESKLKKTKINAKLLNTKIEMLAEKIRNLEVTIKEKVHDENKLYGSISQDEIVELLKEKDISINKKQVEFKKAIKTLGDYKVTIKLSSKVKPELSVKVVSK